MNGTTLIGGGGLANPGPTWHIKATGDFNGDGKSDILWQNDDGTPAIWEMSGTTLIGGAGLANPGPTWHTIGTDGMRFISGASGNGTLSATSEDDSFVFSSYVAGPHAIIGFDPAHDLIVLNRIQFANFASVLAHSTASGAGTRIQFDPWSTLLIQGVMPAALHASDFRFV